MVQTWALPSWKDGRSPEDSRGDSKRWGQASAGQSGVASLPSPPTPPTAPVGVGSGSFVGPAAESDSGLHPAAHSSGIHAAPAPPPPPAPPPAPPPPKANIQSQSPTELDDPLSRSDSDSGTGTHALPPPPPPSDTGNSPQPDLDLTLNYENVIPTPLEAPPGSGRVPVVPVDSGELELPLPDLGEDRVSLTMAPEYESDIGSVDSTAADSRSKPAVVEVSDSVPALDIVSDDQEKQEDAFFSVDSISDEHGDPNREPQPGEVMGDYQLIDILGRGGMGVIYRAQKLGTEELYALKTLNVGSGSASTKRRARFQREVDALRRLTHENIIKVHTCGRKGQWDWYVMDIVEGRELKQAMREEDLKPYEKLSIFIDICKAVQHAHDHNVIHRDLKPANVLLSEGSNAVFVLDFGLAKLSDEDLGLTKTGAALGTPYYMAPEQIVNPKGVDFRVDVFSLGVMLYEMMVGQRPFTGDTAGEVSNKIMNEDPARPSLVNEKLYPSMDAICFKAMEKDAINRYQSVDELRREVAKYRRGAAVKNATALGQRKDEVVRYLERNKQPVLIGVLIASLIYLPIILALLGFG